METNIGGKLQGISLDAFLQMAQMEQITCTLSVVSDRKSGRLFLLNGELVSAEVEDFKNIDAAHRIISWENSIIEIDNTCDKTVNEINQPLMNILMEGMRLRDEAKQAPPGDTPQQFEPEAALELELEQSETAVVEKSVSETPSESPADETTNPTVLRKNTDSSQELKKAPGKRDVSEIKKDPESLKHPAPPKRDAGSSKRPNWLILTIILAVLITAGAVAAHFMSSAKQNRIAYETLLSEVTATESLEEKLRFLNDFLRQNPEGRYAGNVDSEIESIREQIAGQDFEAVKEAATRLVAEDNLEAAISEYKKFRRRTSSSQYNSRAAAAVKALTEKTETRNFEAMKATALTRGPERISVYEVFLEKHPKGKYRKEVLGLISDMEEEYYIFIERRILKNEKVENWQKCIELAQQFMDHYPDSDHIELLRTYQIKCREEIHAALAFKQLRQQAARLGTDTEAVMAVYSDFLKAYPKTPAKEKIEGELQKLVNVSEENRLAEAANRLLSKIAGADDRFIPEKMETFLDRKTGLMWCLLDSRTQLNKCLPYEKASAYVDSLTTGGYDDWRLPTPDELSALYDNRTPFPSPPQRWYWSSKTHKRYTDRWIIDVEIVDPEVLDQDEALQKESWQCGSVRAVRRPERN